MLDWLPRLNGAVRESLDDDTFSGGMYSCVPPCREFVRIVSDGEVRETRGLSTEPPPTRLDQRRPICRDQPVSARTGTAEKHGILRSDSLPYTRTHTYSP